MHIYRAHIIDTPTPKAFRIIPNGYVAVADNGIIDGVYDTLPESLSQAPLTDLGDRLLIPAFCDMHIHAPQYPNMGIAMDLELLPWLNTYTFPQEARYADFDYAQRMYSRFVHSLWLQGSLHSAIFATIHAPATLCLADLLDKAGLSAFVGLVTMDRNCPPTLCHSADEAISDTLALIQHLQGNSRVKPIITPRFIPTCSPDMLTRLGQIAAEQHIPVQSHLSENKGEIEWVKQLEPQSRHYGDAYDRYGLMGQTPTLMAHCCMSSSEEQELLRQRGVMMVHCPSSNLNIATHTAPIRHYMDTGQRLALGSDVSGGHTPSMMQVMLYAIQVSKLYYTQSEGQTPFLKLSEVFWMATRSAGSFFGQVGCLQQGYTFDALVIDDRRLHGSEYSLDQRLERFVYTGDDRDIIHRFCCGNALPEPDCQ